MLYGEPNDEYEHWRYRHLWHVIVMTALRVWAVCICGALATIGYYVLSPEFERSSAFDWSYLRSNLKDSRLLWICVLVGALAYAVAQYDSWLSAKERKRRSGPKRRLYIEGPPAFEESVLRILTELLEKTPHRHQEVLEYLPRAVHGQLESGREGFRLLGRSDGTFSVDASDIGYEDFRWIFLHEVGHNINWHRDQNRTEEAANDYANHVTAELAAYIPRPARPRRFRSRR
jgi:hypothetical protein